MQGRSKRDSESHNIDDDTEHGSFTRRDWVESERTDKLRHTFEVESGLRMAESAETASRVIALLFTSTIDIFAESLTTTHLSLAIDTFVNLISEESKPSRGNCHTKQHRRLNP